MSAERILVVGTTPDYIQLIRERFPGQAFFLTDPAKRAQAPEPPPPASEELVVELSPSDEVLRRLQRHLGRRRLTLGGITAFDCESLSVAAYLAHTLALPYPSRAAVSTSRSKYATKRTWREEGIPCPEVQIVRELQDLVRFQRRLRRPVVVKPLTGSGSELVLMCRDQAEAREAYATISTRLESHSDEGLYGSGGPDPGRLDPRRVFLAEEFVSGTEFSCDFILDDEGVRIVRTARKIIASDPPGTAVAYELPALLPKELDRSLRGLLAVAARSLGLRAALVMVDFIVRDNRILLLEMTPRVGGDCLPPLILQSCGLDMIGLALEFAAGRMVDIPPREEWRHLVGMPLRSPHEGWIQRLRADALLADPRVRECLLKRRVGDRVTLPPEDYSSWVLGHLIFAPTPGREIAAECAELTTLLEIEVAAAPLPITARRTPSGAPGS